jgi:hypothetical protein
MEYGSWPEFGYYKPELPTDGTQVFEAPFDTIHTSKKPVAELSAKTAVSELPESNFTDVTGILCGCRERRLSL